MTSHPTAGPVWYRMVQDTGRCRQHWWTNLLYINNFHPVEFHDTCMSWTWYLANVRCSSLSDSQPPLATIMPWT
jgi:hypothetical protein